MLNDLGCIELQEYVDLGRCSSSTVKRWDYAGVCVMLGSAGNNVHSYTAIASVEIAALGIKIYGAGVFSMSLQEMLNQKHDKNTTNTMIVALAMECALVTAGWGGLIDAIVASRNDALAAAHVAGQEHARGVLRDWLCADRRSDRTAAKEYVK